MIKKILTHFAARLDEYLRQRFPQPEGVAEAGFIGNGPEERPCKLIVSLVNIEREAAGGISAGLSRSGSEYMRNYQSLLLNLDMPSHYPSYLKRYFSFSRIPFLNWTGRNIR